MEFTSASFETILCMDVLTYLRRIFYVYAYTSHILNDNHGILKSLTEFTFTSVQLWLIQSRSHFSVHIYRMNYLSEQIIVTSWSYSCVFMLLERDTIVSQSNESLTLVTNGTYVSRLTSTVVSANFICTITTHAGLVHTFISFWKIISCTYKSILLL